MATATKLGSVLPTRLGGVAVVYDDVTTAVGLARVACEPQAAFSAAGASALLGQAAAYLTAAKVTALVSAGASVTVDLAAKAFSYSCLPADAAAQISALQGLLTAANLTQTGGFPL